MKELTVTTLAGLLVLCVAASAALGQSSTPTAPIQGDELRLRPDANQNVSPNSHTNVIDDSIPSSTPTNNEQNQAQPFPAQNNNIEQQQEQQTRPNHRHRGPRPPFNPFAFLLPPPSFSADPTDFSPFHSSPLMNLLGGGHGSLFDLPSPSDFRAHMDEQIKDMESKPDVWSKEVRQFTINGVQYEKITFTRKVDNGHQQQPAQIDGERNGEPADPASQQAGDESPRAPLFSRPSFRRSFSNLI